MQKWWVFHIHVGSEDGESNAINHSSNQPWLGVILNHPRHYWAYQWAYPNFINPNGGTVFWVFFPWKAPWVYFHHPFTHHGPIRMWVHSIVDHLSGTGSHFMWDVMGHGWSWGLWGYDNICRYTKLHIGIPWQDSLFPRCYRWFISRFVLLIYLYGLGSCCQWIFFGTFNCKVCKGWRPKTLPAAMPRIIRIVYHNLVGGLEHVFYFSIYWQ
jgi:hypothetical protein